MVFSLKEGQTAVAWSLHNRTNSRRVSHRVWCVNFLPLFGSNEFHFLTLKIYFSKEKILCEKFYMYIAIFKKFFPFFHDIILYILFSIIYNREHKQLINIYLISI